MRKATSGRRAGFFPVTLAWLLGQRKRLRVRQNNSPSPPISREHRRRTTDRRMAGGSRSGARIAKVKVRAKRRTFVGGSLEVVRLPLMRMMFAGRRVGRQARRRSSRLTPEDHRHRHVPQKKENNAEISHQVGRCEHEGEARDQRGTLLEPGAANRSRGIGTA